MRRRILDVTAYTTLDFADIRALGHDWTVDASGVVNVTEPDDHEDVDDVVQLQLEVDGGDVDQLPQHVDSIELSPAQARRLANDLNKYADSVDGDP
jgi:hypothetical protein